MIGRTSSAVYCPSDVVVLSTNVNQFTNRVGCRVKGVSGGQPAVRPPVVDSVHRWGGKGGLRPRGLRPLNTPPPLNAPKFRCVEGRGVTSGLFRWGDRRTSSARGMIGRTTSASLVSLRGRRAQHEYEPVHTPYNSRASYPRVVGVGTRLLGSASLMQAEP